MLLEFSNLPLNFWPDNKLSKSLGVSFLDAQSYLL